VIRTTLSGAKIGVLMLVGFVLAVCTLLGALVLGAWAIEPICTFISWVAGRP
jgi:hypothetical protein